MNDYNVYYILYFCFTLCGYSTFAMRCQKMNIRSEKAPEAQAKGAIGRSIVKKTA